MSGFQRLPAAIEALELTAQQARFLALLAERPGEPRQRGELERRIFAKPPRSPAAIGFLAMTVGAKLRRQGFEIATVPPHRGRGGFYLRPCPGDRQPAPIEPEDDEPIEIDPPAATVPAIDDRWDDDEWVRA